MDGADDNVIKDVLGHSSLGTTQHYLATRHPLRNREEELRELYRRRKNNQSEQ
jgi:site-specific recombinase XerD